MAGMIHALTLLTVLLVAAPAARFIPLAGLAGLLLVVAYNVGDWEEIPELLKLTRMDISVWFLTFALTVFADLTLAVELGMILAMLLFIRKVSQTTTVSQVTADYVEAGRVHILQDKEIPPYVSVFRIHGPFLFGTTDKISSIVDQIDDLAADRDRPPAEHDRDRRHRPAGARGSGRPGAQVGTRADSLRRPAAAGGADAPVRVPRAHRRAQHLPQHRSRARARGGDSSNACSDWVIG